MGDYGSLFQYEMNIDDIMRRYDNIFNERQRILEAHQERINQILQMLPPEPQVVSTDWALRNIIGVDDSGSMNEPDSETESTKVTFLNKKK